MSVTKRSLLAGLGAGLLQGCSPLRAFNAVAPRPLNVRRSSDLPYGDLPRQRLDIYRPRGEGPWPLLVFFYGGGWEEGSRKDYGFAGRAYAAQGFLTVVPDYRVTGEAAYPVFLQDCALAVAWAQRHGPAYGGDPARTVLAGHSAGAYNAAMLAMDGRWLAEAGATAPIRAWAGLSGPYDFLPLTAGPALRTFGGVPDPASTQPIRYASRTNPPAFIGWGDEDEVVMPRNSEQLAARLKALGVAVEARAYPSAGHAQTVLALAWPFSLKLPVLRESAAFLRGAVGPR